MRPFLVPPLAHAAPLTAAGLPAEQLPLDLLPTDDLAADPLTVDHLPVDHLAIVTTDPAHWIELVDRIQSGASTGMEELYALFSKGIRFYLCRQLGPQELEDKIHDTFVLVVQAIRRGELREPERLMGFVRTIVRRQVAAHIDRAVHYRRDHMDSDASIRVADHRDNPESCAIFRQRVSMIRRVLRELGRRDREILIRFYLEEESQEQICSEMALTETQFRLLKSRAKARFGELGKKKLAQSALSSVFVRTSAGITH